VGFIFVTGLTGMQLYSDAFHFACTHDTTGNLEPWESHQQGMPWGCGGQRACPTNYSCTEYKANSPGKQGSLFHLSEHLAGFDNIGAAMLTVFQVCIDANLL
jgi:hypothetical protein